MCSVQNVSYIKLLLQICIHTIKDRSSMLMSFFCIFWQRSTLIRSKCNSEHLSSHKCISIALLSPLWYFYKCLCLQLSHEMQGWNVRRTLHGKTTQTGKNQFSLNEHLLPSQKKRICVQKAVFYYMSVTVAQKFTLLLTSRHTDTGNVINHNTVVHKAHL